MKGPGRRHGVRVVWLVMLAFAAMAMVAPSVASAAGPLMPATSYAIKSTDAQLPSYQAVRDRFRASDIVVLDRNRQTVQRVRHDYQVRRGDWVKLGDISPALINAVLLSEDQRFYTHDGVDWQAVAAAAWGNLLNDQHRGASTVSMQLVGLINEQFRRGAAGRSIMQKVDQALNARELERSWTKPQILEAYLNLVSFRGELVGVDALSRILFGKHASGLDARESALAAAMLRAPNASQSVLTRRTCHLLQSMGWPQECGGLAGFVQRSVLRRSDRRADSEGLAPHYARQVLSQNPLEPGESVVTSLDGALQQFAIDSMQRRLQALRASGASDAAVIVLDNATGEVLSYVGSSGDLSQASQVDHAQALRQAGSTLKPFLYAQAIEQQRVTAVSLLDDGPIDLPTGNGLYIPQNYDKRFSGWVSVRTALAASLNIPAVRTLVMVTPDAFQQRLVKLGLPLDRSGDFYGYSLALGSADVSLLALTNAYRALANLGYYSPVRYVRGNDAPAQSSVMPSAAAWIVGDILSDRHARARTFGLDSPLTTAFWSAVKTGTSKDMRDNWSIGWSQRYTVGVWVGNSAGASMRDVSGVSGAGPIWHDVMSYLHRKQGSWQPAAPALVTRQHVSFENQIEPARDEVFIGDTALDYVQLRREAVTVMPRLKIVHPTDKTILALDPDIPAATQRIWLQASSTSADTARNMRWLIDKKVMGTGQKLAWLPWPGRHRIELVDLDGEIVDGVTIEVRGARSD